VCIEEGKSRGPSRFGECSQKEVAATSCSFGFGSACNVDDVLGFDCAYKDVTMASVSGDMPMDDVNNAMKFHTFPGGNVCVEEGKSRGQSRFGECSQQEVGAASCNFDFGSACNMDDMLGFDSDYKDVAIASVSGDTSMDDVNDLEGDEFTPHPALSFSLSYLGLSDLLVVERVCKSLHSTVRGDPLLWRNIDIDQPLNERITDDVLLQLTNRAQGNLRCLRLVECTRITDDGLKRVLEVNPKLVKVSMHQCINSELQCLYVAVHLKHVYVDLYVNWMFLLLILF
jgi:hypothetical protein